MADFILPLGEQGSVRLQFNGGAVNAGITYQVHPGYTHIADVSPTGTILPKKPGNLLVLVLDTEGERLTELAGVVVTDKRFVHQRQLRDGTKKQKLQVIGTVSGLHIGPGLFGTIYTGTTAPLPVISGLQLQRQGGDFRCVFQTDRNDEATYQVDIYEVGVGLTLATASVTESSYSHALTIPFATEAGKTYAFRVTGRRVSDDMAVGAVALPPAGYYITEPPVVISNTAIAVNANGGFTLTFTSTRQSATPYVVEFYRGGDLVMSQTYTRTGYNVSITESTTLPPEGDYLTVVVSNVESGESATIEDVFYVRPGTYPLMEGTVSRPAGAFASGSNVSPQLAFDGLTSSEWVDDTTVSTGSYIGNDLGASHAIRSVSFINGTATEGWVEDVAIEYADSLAGPWISAGTVTNLTEPGATEVINLPDSGAHRYWRLVSTGDTAAGAWTVADIQFSTALQDPAALTDEEAELFGFGEGAFGEDPYGDGFGPNQLTILSVTPGVNAIDTEFRASNPMDARSIKMELLRDSDEQFIASHTVSFTGPEPEGVYTLEFTTALSIPADTYKVRLTDLVDTTTAVSAPFAFQANV